LCFGKAEWLEYACVHNSKDLLFRARPRDPNYNHIRLDVVNKGLLFNNDVERWKYQRGIFLRGLKQELIVEAALAAAAKFDEVCDPRTIV
jgi:hypothetical protein